MRRVPKKVPEFAWCEVCERNPPMRAYPLPILLIGLGCSVDPKAESQHAASPLEQCEDGPTLFGRPEAATGLGSDQCGPACTCGGETFAPAAVSAEQLADLRERRLVEPYGELLEDPYGVADSGPSQSAADGSEETPDGQGVCAVVPLGGVDYRLQTFTDFDAAQAAGAVPTHTGGCGLCSTLTDLAAYMANNDLTEPVRECGLRYFSGPMEEHVQCLEMLGFTRPCAQIWYWNTLYTRSMCLDECLAALDAPYNQPDGSLNPCLQCDEDQSGPVFKRVAGRTRRNTGLPNAICRPCSEVWPLEHAYPR